MRSRAACCSRREVRFCSVMMNSLDCPEADPAVAPPLHHRHVPPTAKSEPPTRHLTVIRRRFPHRWHPSRSPCRSGQVRRCTVRSRDNDFPRADITAPGSAAVPLFRESAASYSDSTVPDQAPEPPKAPEVPIRSSPPASPRRWPRAARRSHRAGAVEPREPRGRKPRAMGRAAPRAPRGQTRPGARSSSPI